MTTSRYDHPIVSLTTDFGLDDGYVGAMQGIILDICPAATICMISHTIPPQDIQTAAFVLYQIIDYYPSRAVHCVVVDPGVGSERRAVAIKTNQGILVGPDNGVFSFVLDVVDVLETVTLTNPHYQLPWVSATFHGRDIFAPAAAHIATGVPVAEFGPPAANLTRIEFGSGLKPDECRIIHIDHFGNLVLSLTVNDVSTADQVTFQIGQTVVRTLNRTFSDVEEGEFLAYIGSCRDHIEIGLRNGNAAEALGLQLNDVVPVTMKPG
jgi:S-adenosylmethionine hydrolase